MVSASNVLLWFVWAALAWLYVSNVEVIAVGDVVVDVGSSDAVDVDCIDVVGTAGEVRVEMVGELLTEGIILLVEQIRIRKG